MPKGDMRVNRTGVEGIWAAMGGHEYEDVDENEDVHGHEWEYE
jgi:hypothetical protein